MKNSAIQWCDHTFNAWEGCTKVAPECKNCYAETLVDHRFGRAKWGKGHPRRRTSAAYWQQPLVWNRKAEETSNVQRSTSNVELRRPRVFCLSLGDWLDEEVRIEWLADLLALIHATPNLDWLLLTKRPENFRKRMELCAVLLRPDRDHNNIATRWVHFGEAPLNVWIGVSAGADQRAALEIPAKIHFLSCEPMLQPLDHFYLPTQEFDWIIFGGESGKHARPCDVGWIRDGLKFCQRNNIAAFVKQLGARPFENHKPVTPTPEEEQLWHRHGWCKVSFADGSGRGPVWSKIYQLRDSHGGDMSEWPEDLRVREFPETSNVQRQSSEFRDPSSEIV